MKIDLWVNHPREVQAGQTTAMLAAAAVRRGHTVHVAGVADLFVDVDDRVGAAGVVLPPEARTAVGVAEALRHGALVDVEVSGFDAVLVRTSPGRDARAWAHQTALVIGELLVHQGVDVVNRPSGLARAGGKLYQAWLPRHLRPETLVAADAARLVRHLRQGSETMVLKPAVGTRGRDVFRVTPDDANASVIAEALVRDNYAMAQAYLPEADAGDTRVLLLDGRLIEIDGAVAAVRRVPQAGEFRSNVHTGADVAPAPLTPVMREAAAALGERLRADGLWLVGMDLIGDRLVELNVFSTGGLRDAERFTGCDFSSHIIENLERRHAHGRP